MVALTLGAQVACIQARGKGKEYIVENYLDSCMKSSNYCENFFLFFKSYAFDWLRYKDSMQLIAMANKNPIPPHPRKHSNP